MVSLGLSWNFAAMFVGMAFGLLFVVPFTWFFYLERSTPRLRQSWGADFIDALERLFTWQRSLFVGSAMVTYLVATQAAMLGGDIGALLAQAPLSSAHIGTISLAFLGMQGTVSPEQVAAGALVLFVLAVVVKYA